jgi:predicted transposase YbfD/YdcC
LNGYLDWPDVGQVFELKRVRVGKGQTQGEVVYGMTSLRRDRSAAADLLQRVRGHWGIENGLHYVRDETLGEDRCRVRLGNGAQVLTALRNAVVHLWRGSRRGARRPPLAASPRTRKRPFLSSLPEAYRERALGILDSTVAFWHIFAHLLAFHDPRSVGETATPPLIRHQETAQVFGTR